MSAPQIPKALQDEAIALQKISENISALHQNVNNLEKFVSEKKKAVEELSEVEDDAVVYKMVGNILIKSEKSVVLEGLEDDVLKSEMRIKTLKRKLNSDEKDHKERGQRLQESYETFMGKQPK